MNRHQSYWTTDRCRAEFLAEAIRVSHTPRTQDLPQPLAQAIHRLGHSIAGMARLCGLVPNTGKGRTEPLPAATVDVPEPDANLHTLVARELAASEKRRRARAAAEPWTVKLPPQPMERRGDFFGRRRALQDDDFLPPEDLTVSKRRVR